MRNVSNKVTLWIRILPENLTDPKLFKKCPSFYGTHRFITAFTREHHLFLF
jgi:hypothetical protein